MAAKRKRGRPSKNEKLDISALYDDIAVLLEAIYFQGNNRQLQYHGPGQFTEVEDNSPMLPSKRLLGEFGQLVRKFLEDVTRLNIAESDPLNLVKKYMDPLIEIYLRVRERKNYPPFQNREEYENAIRDMLQDAQLENVDEVMTTLAIDSDEIRDMGGPKTAARLTLGTAFELNGSSRRSVEDKLKAEPQVGRFYQKGMFFLPALRELLLREGYSERACDQVIGTLQYAGKEPGPPVYNKGVGTYIRLT